MTTACDDDREVREDVTIDGGAVRTTDPEDVVLITEPDFEAALTARSEVDVHSAICLGLAAYVAGLSFDVAGRRIAFTRVVSDWSDHDDGPLPAPTARVGSVEMGTYSTEGDLGAQVPIVLDRDPGNPMRILTLNYCALYELDDLRVEAMCEDKEQRAGVRHMLENAFWPIDWMRGFQLALPRYHNATCQFSVVSAKQEDTPEEAAAGLWPLAFSLRAWCPVYRLHSKPLGRAAVGGTIQVTRQR